MSAARGLHTTAPAGAATPSPAGGAAERVRRAYERIAEVGRPEIWIALREIDDAVAEAEAVDARVAAGEILPLAGMTLAVKDNIDVAGIPTTAGCPAYAYEPTEDAPVVARLRAAGATVLGKTNLDQFATGLVGTRSPYGAVGDARRPEYVAGGSSSGSAVAVALGIADLSLGTDTAGSGRVPAAFQGIVGVKPTFGLVPVRGSVPACLSLDCITVFARGLDLAQEAIWVMAGEDAADPTSRSWPDDAPLAAPPSAVLAVPDPRALGDLTEEARAAFAATVERAAAAGFEIATIDVTPFVQTGLLLYEGGFVAERHAAVGAFVDAHRDAVDPTVGAIVAAAGTVRATELFADTERLGRLRVAALAALDGCDALLMPTTTRQPTIEQVAAEPVAANSRLGLYTNFCNLLDMCGVAVPAGSADGGCFGVTVLAQAFGDRVAADVAARLVGVAPPEPVAAPGGIELLVVGAHRSGQPLHHQLTERGARFAGVVRTAPAYRLYALETTPPKPGLVRVGEGGVSIEGELWRLSPAALGSFLAELPEPMTLGSVTLADGRAVVGFGVEQAAVVGARDISEMGSWLSYLAAIAR